MTRTRTDLGAASVGAVAGVIAILVVVGGVFLGLRSGDGTGTSADPSDGSTSSVASTTESGPGTDEGSPSDSESADGREAWLQEAVAAAKDGYPAFVPADIPAGWTAGAAEYVPDTSWHLDLTAPSGATVSIDQRSSGKTDSVVESLLGDGTERAGTVNLRRWGTGTWRTYTAGDDTALAQSLTGTVVVVSGATGKDEIVEITKQLLTAEMVVNVGDGSDG